MILVDANLLLYAKISSYSQHKQAKAWLDETLSSDMRIGFPWESIVAFIRVCTNPRIFKRPLSVEDAWNQVEEWLACPYTWVPTPEHNHIETLKRQIPFCKGESGLIHDAQLVALAISHGLVIYSADNDFGRFKEVRWVNPLDSKALD